MFLSTPSRRLAVLASVATAWIAASAHAGILGGPIVNPANGYSYYILTESSWTAAQAEAVSLGGHLVTIRNAAENQWIFDTFAAFGGVDRNLWIGMNDVAVDGTFVWVNGDPVTYTNWAPGEPNNGGGGQAEQYAHMWAANQGFGSLRTPGTWNDAINDPNPILAIFAIPTPFYGVVEVIPEPAAASLLLPAAMLLRRRPR
ncbi:MAG: C-type lectin domain-containing protein [Tepidisphaerales bacterium]